MELSEFDLIARYFARGGRADVVLGVGDDCALLQVPPGMELAVCIDTLVEGVHFSSGTDPYSLGYKLMAVNLSDLAAMGAEPAWATLALTLPKADEAWLEDFSRGLFELAAKFAVQLVGGDTTHGPLTLTLQAHGLVPQGKALRRHGARPGDLIWVTGTPGDAALALQARRGESTLLSQWVPYLSRRLDRPMPRIREGMALRGIAGAAIDISDGLAADLGHLLSASAVGATLHCEQLPASQALRAHVGKEAAWKLVLGGGDDYELCFTSAPTRTGALRAQFAAFECGCTCIGSIEATPGLRCIDADRRLLPAPQGYRHFGSPV